MKLLKSLYLDSKGNVWEVQKESLPKKKGYFVYWIAECKSTNKSLRSSLKRDLKKQIETGG